MKALILAAGEGTRFRPHTLTVPKPAIPFLNIPMGYYALPWLKQVGVDSLVVNTFHLPEKVTALFNQQSKFKVEFSKEVGKILGSGGGLKKAESLFAGQKNLFLLNSDEIYLTSEKNVFGRLLEKHETSRTISTLLVTNHPEVGSKFGGIWVDQKGEVIGFGKTKPVGAARGYHFLGCQILSDKIFNYLEANTEQNILYDGLVKAIQDGHSVQFLEIKCDWYETGNLKDYLEATEQVLKHISNSTLAGNQFLNSMQILDPGSRLVIQDGCMVWKHNSAQISNCRFEGFAVLGKNVKLENCQISQSVFAEGQHFSGEKFHQTLQI